MTPPETLRAYVNTWECDENDHLNVQFYFGYFEDAAAQFLAMAGLPRATPTVRHVRYHRELRRDSCVVGHSHAVAGAPAEVVHVLRDTGSGEVVATALETYGTPGEDGAAALARWSAPCPDVAAPRSVAGGASASLGLAADAFEGGFTTYRGRLRTADCDRNGRPYARAIIGRASDAATQFWSGLGVTPAWLAERGVGRVAVEMKLTPGSGGEPDALLHVLSRLNEVGRSTISFEHLVVATETGEVVASIDTTALTMDLKTRRAARLPEEMRASMERLVRAGRSEGRL